MPPSILILTNRVPFPLHDGGALAMDAMIRGYHKAGWQVHLLAMNTSRHFVSQDVLSGLYSQLASFQTISIDNELSKWGILKNLLFSSEPEHATRFRNNAFAQKLRSLLSQVNPDFVQLESPFLASYIPIIRAGSTASIIYRAHNIEGQIWRRLADASSGFRKTYLNILARRMDSYEQKLWKEADFLLPISDADEVIIQQHNVKTPIVVAPFGIKAPKEDVALPREPFKAYHIGAMDWLPNREGIEWFLREVWPLVHQWAPEMEFHFAGRAMPEALRHNLPEGAFCAGEVGDAQAFIADKHILVVPIQSGSGIRVKTLEAMAAGKLVISTDVGMQGIAAQSEMHYLRAADAQLFAHLIAWASTHGEKVATVTFFAQQLIRERYDADTIMQKVINGLRMTKAL